MKEIYKSLILKVMILTSFLFIVSFLGKNYKEVYASTISSEEIMQKELQDLKKNNKELEEKYLELYNITKIVKTVIVIFLGGSGISIYKIKKKIDKEVEKRVSEEVDKEVSKKVPVEVSEKIGEETNRIELMINASKKEEQLKNEKNILVISQNDEEEKEIQRLLKPFKKITTIKTIDDIKELNQYDVIFFNDINGNIKDEDMKKIINRNSNDKAVYFYFNKRNIRDPKINKMFRYEGNENINFAKSNTTLYGNLIDLMKYQEEILKKEN